MASVEQRALAEDVKSVHRKLREQLLEGRKAEEVCRVVTHYWWASLLRFIICFAHLRFGRTMFKIRRLWTNIVRA